MCGIVGAFSRREPVSMVALEDATRSLYHRGPDGRRHWISPDRRVALGHTRLKHYRSSSPAISPSPARTAAPASWSTRSSTGTNHPHTTERPWSSAQHPVRQRDCPPPLRGFWRSLPQASLRGEFALILWDENRRRIFAARDRFGIKPLFYAWHNDQLFLASEVKALFAAGVPARWDEEGVYYSVSFGGYQSRTLYDGIFQIPPGHFLLVTDKHVQVSRYWDFNYPAKDQAPTARSDADYAAEFRHVFEEAVRIRLRADVPVGVYLSGGLDSCSVLGLAARHHPEPVKAFTLTFEDVAYDEGPIARRNGPESRRRVLSHPHQPAPPGRQLRRCHRANRNRLLQCARRSQVSAQPRRARCRLQGGHHGRRLR